MKPKIKYQQYAIIVPSAGAIVPIEYATDKLYSIATGINVILTNPNNIFSPFELAINTVEVFPEDFEVLRVLFRTQVPFGYDYHELNEKAAGSVVKGKYIDIDSGAVYPYKVIISLRLENEEK